MASERLAARQPGQTFCVHHPDKTVTLFCELCKALACLTCLSTEHKGHEMCALNELTANTRTQIQKYIDSTEESQCSQLQLLIKWAENELSQTSQKYDKLTQDIERQGKRVKLKIDVLTCMYKGVYKQLEEENKRNLVTFINEVQSRLDALNDNLRNCRHVLREGTDIQTYDTGHSLIAEPVHSLPVQPTCHHFSFVPNYAPTDCLEKAFGVLTTSAEMKPIVHTKIISEFRLSEFISCVTPNGEGGAWICDNSNIVTLLDREGKAEKVLKYKVPIREVQVSPMTKNLWICTDSHYEVKECDITSKETVTRFTLDSDSYSLCVTANENILIGMSKKMIKFTTCGTVLLSSGSAEKTSFFQRSVPLVRSAYRITECPVTKHVAVIDMDREKDGGHSQTSVLVTDKDFGQIFSYKGSLPESNVGCKIKNPFSPCDIKFDTIGHLLISDKSNGCIRLLTGEGQFIRLVYVSSSDAGVIGIDSQNINLWAVFDRSKVKVLKYIE
ncbi:uncharacterized protein [Argopecten irradians]|uniref:uncharacterized protein n=1 Tax=Argopecten irradians TaxID=31199 RepID=UPI003718D582